MQLRDRGLLTLDDKVTRWVPELREIHDPYGMIDSITIRMLLSHSAGFQNPTWPWGNGEPWEPFEPTTWNQLVAMMPYEQLLFKPGSKYSYSNPGFIYLARIIEKMTGDPWQSYVQKNLLSPLGLDRSYFGSTPYYLAADRSHNYYVRHDSTTKRDSMIDNGADFDPGITIPNGGWNSPLDDLATYLAFLTNSPGGRLPKERYDVILKRSTLEEMWQSGREHERERLRLGERLDGVVVLRYAARRRDDSRSHGESGGLSRVHVLRSGEAHGGAGGVQYHGGSKLAGRPRGAEDDDGGGVGAPQVRSADATSRLNGHRRDR